MRAKVSLLRYPFAWGCEGLPLSSISGDRSKIAEGTRAILEAVSVATPLNISSAIAIKGASDRVK